MTPDDVTSVAYVRHFVKELTPTLLRAAAALNGIVPPPAEDFDYCELGSGRGDTMCALAAAYPRARFVGVDLSREHVAFANDLAKRGGVTNVRFVDRDIEDLAAQALPAFDYVCAHGILTWIAPEKRRALFRIAASKLKPGGVLYLGYNAQPGWAAIEPLRRLMLETSSAVDGDLAARVRYGLDVARVFAEGGAEYFAGSPAARELLATTLRMGVPYAAHEYFVADWHPMYFADVAREAGEHGLCFAGQLPLYRAVPELVVPRSLTNVLARVKDRMAFETLADFATNAFFRHDLFVGGAARLDGATRRAWAETTPFGTLVPAEEIKREVRLPHHTLRYDGPIFDALVARLAERRANVNELARELALGSFGRDALRDAVLQLAYGEQVTPMLAASARAPSGSRGRLRLPLPYNRAVLHQRLSSQHPILFASPSSGTAYSLSPLHAVALLALTDVEPADRAAWIHAVVNGHSLRLWVRDRAVDSKEEQASIIDKEIEAFRTKRLPKLVELGIVENGE